MAKEKMGETVQLYGTEETKKRRNVSMVIGLIAIMIMWSLFSFSLSNGNL